MDLLPEIDKSKVSPFVVPEGRLQWIEVLMRSEKVMNIDSSFKELDSEITKIKGKNEP